MLLYYIYPQNSSAANKGKWNMLDTKFLSPQLFSDQHKREINSCGTVHHKRKGTPHTLGQKALQLKKGDILCKVKGGTHAVCWQDKRSLHHHQHVQPPSIMSFCG